MHVYNVYKTTHDDDDEEEEEEEEDGCGSWQFLSSLASYASCHDWLILSWLLWQYHGKVMISVG